MIVRSVVILCLTFLGLPASAALATPAAVAWERFAAHDEANDATLDHSLWDRLLKAYVVSDRDGINRVDYGGVNTADRAALRTYLETLSKTPITSLARAEQQAFWINLYNALTLDVVLDHYPVGSIRKIAISPGWFSVGPWGKKLLSVEGEMVSLDDIEHRILRPIWKDSRIHYAVNCASIGCPNLRKEAFSAENTEACLEAGARDYVNHTRGARVETGRLIVSSIYDWFADDFGGSAGVIAHLKRYADPPLAQTLDGIETIYDDEYDWSLNDSAR